MKILLHQHPLSGEPPQEFQADSLAQWLLDRYERGPRVSFQVFEGEPSARTEITRAADAILRAQGPEYVVLESPGIPAAYGIWAIIGNMAISMALSAAINFMFGKNPKPLDARGQESPNNQLSNRENRVRALERIEDIYGTVRAIPSVVMLPYNKYVNHVKVEVGLYCPGRGYHEISDVRDGNTLISEISDASAAVYAPFTSPNSGSPQLSIGPAIIDKVLSVARSGSVDGIVLKAQNQIELGATLPYVISGAGGFFPPGGVSTVDFVYQPPTARKPNVAAVAEVGQALTITMANASVKRTTQGNITVDAATKTYTLTLAPAGFFRGVVDGTTVVISLGTLTDPANVGTKTIVSHTEQSITVAEAVADETAIASSGSTADFTVTINYSGTRTIAAVESGYATLTGASQFSSIELPVNHGGISPAASLSVANGLTDWTDWSTLPEADRTEVWTNVKAEAGMYLDDGAKHTTSVAYEIQIEQLTALFVPTGVVETVSGLISGATTKERAETLERVTAWTGPARARARRTTPFNYSFSGLVVDEIKLVDLYSVAPVNKPHFGNVTLIHTVRKGNPAATSLRRSELNCLASRKLPTFNGAFFSATLNSDGLLTAGTLHPTSRIVDIIAAVSLDPKIGNRQISDLDIGQIWAVQQALDAWHPACGQFNYTFDTDNLSFEETVSAIANAAFCVPYRQNGKIRLALDRPQPTSAACFTHGRKRPGAETITRTFASEGEYDGVELIYMDPETEDQESIRLPPDGSYTRLKRVEITGIRSYEQAWFRANREYRRQIGQRLSIETEVTTDARALLPNLRVDIVDNTRIKSFDGEVVGQSGLTLTLSRDVEFVSALPHSIVLTQRAGAIESIVCTPGPQPNQVVLATPPAEAIHTEFSNEDGHRTTFSFAADSARGAMAWQVREITPTDGPYLRLTATNYRDDYYAADSQAIPAKSGVIN